VHSDLVHHVEVAIKAKELFRNEVDYIIKEGEVLIVDEFTGAWMVGRRYSDASTRAIEARKA